jgi:hypothetical protein
VPGPGFYNIEVEEERKKANSVQFRSKVPRFLKDAELLVGPGMYEIEGDFDRAVRRIRSPHSPIVRAIKSPTIKTVKSIDMPEPGPGSYDAVDTLQREMLKKYVSGYKGDFGCRE